MLLPLPLLPACLPACSDDKHRVCFSLIAQFAMLSDPPAAHKLVLNERLASGLLTLVACRVNRDEAWVRGAGALSVLAWQADWLA